MYSRRIKGREATFGVSGLLYKSNVLMYDRQTESLWSQVKSQAVTGPLSGTKLEVLPSTLTTWEKWQQQHPDTLVLSLDTGYEREYSQDPYQDYYQSRSGLFGLFRGLFEGHEGKELIVGIAHNGSAMAYPLTVLRQQVKMTTILAGEKLSFEYDSATEALLVTDEHGKVVPYITTYWFVWKGAYPQTQRHEQKQ